MHEDGTPKTLQEAIIFFSTPERCHDYVVSMRWPNEVTCPRCGSDKVGKFSGKRMVSNCKSCKKQFTVKTGTIFADSPLPLSKWLPAVWMIVNAKNGISSYELGRSLGVTQKTAWFMLHRIRLAMQNNTLVKLGGEVEVDETYIGGKARNMHRGKRKVRGTGVVGKTAVQGLLERGAKSSKIVLKVLKNVKIPTLQANVKEYVLEGSSVYTDALTAYRGLNGEYNHEFVDHAETYVRGKVHTNGLENFWSLLKRSIRGTYVSVEPFHLFRYLDEQTFRFNERKDDDQGRFIKTVNGIVGKGIKYADLIGKGGEDLLPV